MSEEKKIKVINGEGQETLVPEHIANDEPTLKRLLASFYGTDNFRIERKEENGETVLKVVKMAGSKGRAASPVSALVDCQGGQNPVILLYAEMDDETRRAYVANDVNLAVQLYVRMCGVYLPALR